VIGSNRIEALPIRLTDRDFADCDTVNAALDGQLDLGIPGRRECDPLRQICDRS